MGLRCGNGPAEAKVPNHLKSESDDDDADEGLDDQRLHPGANRAPTDHTRAKRRRRSATSTPCIHIVHLRQGTRAEYATALRRRRRRRRRLDGHAHALRRQLSGERTDVHGCLFARHLRIVVRCKHRSGDRRTRSYA